jgi:hypothetical protein
VQQALMELKVRPDRPVLSVLLAQLVLKDCQGLKGTRD